MFLQSAFLLGLAAVLVPILVHLLSRQQVMRVELGTTRFLYEILSDTSRRRRIRRWLLLLTRMAILAIAALMFARPSLPTYEDLFGDALRIVLIDRSGSMQAPGKNGRAQDDALTEARAAAEHFGKNKTVLWAAFDSVVEPLESQPNTQPRLAPRLAADTNYAAALMWARDRLAAGDVSDAQVLLVTDLQMTGMAGEREPGIELLPPDVPVRVIDVGRREVQNVAVQAIESRSAGSANEPKLMLAATIFNFGSMPAEDLPASAMATNGTQTLRLKKTIDVAPSQASEALFDFGKVQPGIWQITIDIDVADDLAFDNRRWSAMEINRPDPVLIVDNGSAEQSQSSSSYCLMLALNAAVQPDTTLDQTDNAEPEASSSSANLRISQGQFAARQWFWRDQGLPEFSAEKPALVVVSDAADLTAAMVLRLEEYVKAGGRLLVFAGSTATQDPLRAWQAGLLKPGNLLQQENAVTMPFRITDIEATSSMLAPFLDPQHGDLSRLAFTSLLSVDMVPKDRVLAKFDGERPAITQHAVGNGRVAWFMASADDRSGAWTTSPLYLPLVRQMAADLLGRTGEGPIRFRHVGDPLPDQMEWPSNRKQAQNDSISSSDSTSKTLHFEQPGFIQPTHEPILFVVNPAPKESDPTRVEATELAKQLGVKLLEEDTEAEQVQATASFYELWPYLACALVTLLVLEFVLANRTSA